MKIKEIKDDAICFDNGWYLEDCHHQDCCETVYADFEGIKLASAYFTEKTELKDLDLAFDENMLKDVEIMEEVGFKLIDKNGIALMVECYDIQNGYYSSDLALILKDEDGNVIDTLNIGDATKSIYR